MLVPAGQADILNMWVGMRIKPLEEEIVAWMLPLADGDASVIDADPVALERRGAAEADGSNINSSGSIGLDPEAFVPMAAQDDGVVAAGVRLVVVVLAPKLVAEDQGDIVLG